MSSTPTLKINLIVFLKACLFMAFSLTASGAQAPPGTNLTKLLDKYEIPRNAVSIDIREVDSQTPILALNRDQPRNPASAIKLLTTLAALEILSPAYHWETRYHVDGAVKNGVLEGNLIMVAGGDPYLTPEQLWLQVQSIKQKGIHTIKGNLVIDDSHFERIVHDRNAFDGKPTRLYNVGPYAGLTNFSATWFTIEPANGGISIAVDPPLPNLIINNNLKLKKGKCTSRQSGWSLKVKPKGDKQVIDFSGKYSSQCGTYSFGRSVVADTGCGDGVPPGWTAGVGADDGHLGSDSRVSGCGYHCMGLRVDAGRDYDDESCGPDAGR